MYHWCRIDGVIETGRLDRSEHLDFWGLILTFLQDMPDSELGFGSIESSTHGQVLWVNLDHGRSRIDFALNTELYEKYGRHMTQAQAVEQARKAMRPFSCEFETVDWHTVYKFKHVDSSNRGSVSWIIKCHHREAQDRAIRCCHSHVSKV